MEIITFFCQLYIFELKLNEKTTKRSSVLFFWTNQTTLHFCSNDTEKRCFPLRQNELNWKHEKGLKVKTIFRYYCDYMYLDKCWTSWSDVLSNQNISSKTRTKQTNKKRKKYHFISSIQFNISCLLLCAKNLIKNHKNMFNSHIVSEHNRKMVKQICERNMEYVIRGIRSWHQYDKKSSQWMFSDCQNHVV